MELILINESKLKIMLTDSDMEKYDLKAETVDYDNTATRRAFWSILDDAKTETGFNAASDRLFIQIYPSRDGGCEMFVTKLDTPDISYSDKKSRRNSLKCEERLFVYSFECLNFLMRVCKQLWILGRKGRSGAYVEDNGKCYLFLWEKSADAPQTHLFIGEYGTAEHAETMLLYIKEHTAPLCEEKAVETLGAL